MVLMKYSSIRLQVSYCCNHQVYIIYDLKIKTKCTIFYQYKRISFHVYVRKVQISFHIFKQ